MHDSSGPRWLRLASWLLACLLAGLSMTARADDLAQVRALQAAGKLPQALTQVRDLIAQRPGDPQYRLTEALILQQQRHDEQAMDVLQGLIAQYPELPEPYNNLAVLYAARGEYDLALRELRMALRTNPDYATAASNLGDVYLQLARQAYGQALHGTDASAQQHARLALQRLGAAAVGTRPVAPAASAASGASRAATPPDAAAPALRADPGTPR
ncbi:MAG: tetratricopeptide repeat protein [Betaproteobacteria bacterium]|nr:tetratricopeptide repeat protein [Betaproteobacteria bacterium]